MADDGKRIISIDNDADPGEKFPDNVREELGAVIDGRLGMGSSEDEDMAKFSVVGTEYRLGTVFDEWWGGGFNTEGWTIPEDRWSHTEGGFLVAPGSDYSTLVAPMLSALGEDHFVVGAHYVVELGIGWMVTDGAAIEVQFGGTNYWISPPGGITADSENPYWDYSYLTFSWTASELDVTQTPYIAFNASAEVGAVLQWGYAYRVNIRPVFGVYTDGDDLLFSITENGMLTQDLMLDDSDLELYGGSVRFYDGPNGDNIWRLYNNGCIRTFNNSTGSPGQVLTVENSEIGRAMWADLPLRPVDAPPESSSSVGSRGQYYLPTEAADPGPTYMYVCLADNLWGRYELDLDWP